MFRAVDIDFRWFKGVISIVSFPIGVQIAVVTATALGIAVDAVFSAIEHNDDWIQIDSIVDDVADSLNETGLTVD